MAEHKKDTGYCWVILIAAFLCQMIALGVLLCFGIYIVTLIDYFHCSKRAATTVGAIGYSMLCLTGPFAGALYRKYGCRIVIQVGGLLSTVGLFASYFVTDLYQLYFTFFVVGLGFGLVYSSSVGILPDYFDKYRYFATSFATVGSAVGTFVFSPLFLALINEYTWKGSMLINAGIVLHIVVLGALMKSRSLQVDQHWKELFEIHLFKNPQFISVILDGIVTGGIAFIAFGLANQMVINHGIETHNSTIIVSIMGLCNVIGRLGSSVIAHFACTDRVIYFAIVGAFCGTFSCLASLCTGFLSFAVILGLFGLFYGAKLSQLAAINMDLFGPKKLVTTIGYSMFGYGIGGFCLPLLAGYIADVSRIEDAYILAGICLLVSFVVFVILIIIPRCKKQTSVNEVVDETIVLNGYSVKSTSE